MEVRAFSTTVHSSMFNNVGRAVTLNACITSGQNVLITGIGGGVALIAMQICLAIGANVYVTSGSQDKIQKAVALGAMGGFSYNDRESIELSFTVLTINDVHHSGVADLSSKSFIQGKRSAVGCCY